MARAIMIRQHPTDSGRPALVAAIEDVAPEELGEAPVLVDVAYSGINYKDALALTGRPGVVKTTPVVAGIDLVGTVRESADPAWEPGTAVIVNGFGLSETRNGGLAGIARMLPEHLVRLPAGLSPWQAAALGTAGYSAALCVRRLQDEGLETGADHPVLVTGATGGVGSIAVALLAHCGHHVVALTGRPEQYAEYLSSLGAAEILPRSALLGSGKPLQPQRWAGVVDAVGGEVLANALAQTRYGGIVTACGLAGSAGLPATVMPFILRSVTLAGIDSVQAPLSDREAAWRLLERDLDLTLLDDLTRTVPLGGAIEAAQRLLDGHSHGRIVVDVRA